MRRAAALPQTGHMPAYHLESGADPAREDVVSSGLVAYNDRHSAMLRQRLTPEHRQSTPVESYVLSEAGEVVGGCTGRAVPLWGWLEIDLMWVRDDTMCAAMAGARA